MEGDSNQDGILACGGGADGALTEGDGDASRSQPREALACDDASVATAGLSGLSAVVELIQTERVTGEEHSAARLRV